MVFLDKRFINSKLTSAFAYDPMGRLTEHKLSDHANHTDITEVFAFDPTLNRVSLPDTGSIDNKTKRPNKLITATYEISYVYDSHGRILYKTKTQTKHFSKKSN